MLGRAYIRKSIHSYTVLPIQTKHQHLSQLTGFINRLSKP